MTVAHARSRLDRRRRHRWRCRMVAADRCGRTGAEPRDYPVKPVPFTAVHFTDAFWLPRIETNRKVSIPFAFEKCEETKRVYNFERAGAVLRGEQLKDKTPPGYPFDDTDLYKVIEGAAYTLSVQPGPEARGLPRLPDRQDRRRAGEGRLPLHDADDRSRAPAPLGGDEALGAGEGRQPRAVRPGPPLRGGGRALPGHGQADAARRGPADGGPARPDVRAGQAVDLARARDHRDGAGQALPRHRRRALPQPRPVPARRARAGRHGGSGPEVQPVAGEGRGPDGGGRPRRARHLPVFGHGRRRRPHR